MRQRHGYSLTEVMVAILILALCILPLYKVFTASRRSVFRSRISYMALQVGREFMEELRQLPFDTLPEVARAYANFKPVEGGLFALTRTHRNGDGTAGGDGEGLDAEALRYPPSYRRIKVRLAVEAVGDVAIEKADLANCTLHVMWEETGRDKTREKRQAEVERTRFVTVISRFGPGSEQ